MTCPPEPRSWQHQTARHLVPKTETCTQCQHVAGRVSAAVARVCSQAAGAGAGECQAQRSSGGSCTQVSSGLLAGGAGLAEVRGTVNNVPLDFTLLLKSNPVAPEIRTGSICNLIGVLDLGELWQDT